MKICVTSTGDTLDSDVDPRFGRCRYFLILDTDTMKFKSISNESAITSGGAGIQAAQTIAKAGVEVVITGNMGPNAFQTLSAAGITVFTGVNGNIKEAVEKYKKGEMKKTLAPSVGSHFGMGRSGGGFGRGREI